MVLVQYQVVNDGICTLLTGVDETELVWLLSGAYNRLPSGSQLTILKVTEKNLAGEVIARENILVTNRTGNQITISTRAVEAVPIDDDATSNIQQALPFSAGATLEVVFSKLLYDNIIAELVAVQTRVSNLIASQIAMQSATGNDSYATTFATNDTGYIDGKPYSFISDVANTGVCTYNANGWGAKAIKKLNDQDMETGDIEAEHIVELRYNATNDVFEFQGQNAYIPTPVVDKLQKVFTVGEAYTAEDMHYMDYDGKTYKWVGLESSFSQITGVTLAATGTSGFYKIKMIDTNTIIVVWGSSSTTTFSAIAGTINAVTGAFTWGTAQVGFVTNASANNFDIEKIATGKIVVVWEISGNAQGRVLSVSGTTITLGTALNIGNAIGALSGSFPVAVCEIGTDKFAIVRYVTGPLLQMTVCTVSGTTITVGTSSTYSETPVTTLNIFKLATDKFMIAYNFSGSVMKIRPCSVSGTTITQGTLTATTSSENSLSIFDGYQVATDLVLLAGKITSSGFMGGMLISASGTVGTFNTMYTFGNVTITAVRVGDLNPNTAYLIENPIDGQTAGNDTAKVYFISINQTSKKLTLINSETLEVHSQMQNAEKWKNNQFIQGKLGSNLLSNVQLGYKNNSKKAIVGKVKSSGSVDTTATFELRGKIGSGYSGLQSSMRYYLDNLGSLPGIDADGEFLGIAVSATEIMYL